MKQTDIKPCIGCGQGVMHDNQLVFYRIEIDRMVADIGAIQRQHGLEMSMGAAAPLASIMGPDEDVAKSFAKHEVLVCNECSFKPFAQLLESVSEAEPEPTPTPSEDG